MSLCETPYLVYRGVTALKIAVGQDAILSYGALTTFHASWCPSGHVNSYQVEALCPSRGLQVSVTRRFATFVDLLLTRGEEKLRVELVLDSPFRFEPPILSEYGVWVNDFQDLKIDKLLAYFGRAEPRDAIDLYLILQQESVDSLLALAAQKDPGFDLYWFAVALNRAAEFPDEPERWPVKMLLPFDPPALKRTFHSLAMELMSRVTSGNVPGQLR